MGNQPTIPPEDGVYDFERYRDYLKLMSRLHVGSAFSGKLDLSGVVQETLLEAHLADGKLRSLTETALMAWLRQALSCNLADALRKLGTAARDVSRERPLLESMESSSARLEEWLAADHSTPTRKASRNEQLLRLAHALGQLPDDQRTAVELRHLQGLPVAQVAQLLGRSRDAAAGLIFRGLQLLRQLLKE